jgi:hypothetical protein
MKQISQWEQRKAKDSASEVKIVANTVLVAPMHPRKQTECFADMSEDNENQACSSEQL